MKFPDGEVYEYHVGKTTVTVEQRELVMCRSCRYCHQSVVFGVTFLRCDQNYDAKREVYPTDWCSYGKRRNEC